MEGRERGESSELRPGRLHFPLPTGEHHSITRGIRPSAVHVPHVRPDTLCFHDTYHDTESRVVGVREVGLSLPWSRPVLPGREWPKGITDTTLSGGSLGSCVDEERSQLRELV